MAVTKAGKNQMNDSEKIQQRAWPPMWLLTFSVLKSFAIGSALSFFFIGIIRIAQVLVPNFALGDMALGWKLLVVLLAVANLGYLLTFLSLHLGSRMDGLRGTLFLLGIALIHLLINLALIYNWNGIERLMYGA